MRFNMWKKMDEMRFGIQILMGVIVLLVVLNFMLWIGWMHSPKHLTVYIPPDLTQGAMIQPEKIPNSTVYAFAFQIFTAINTWSQNGKEDYKRNINAYRNYLSPHFYQALRKDYLNASVSGSLSSRVRLTGGLSNMPYQPSDVKKLGNGTWLVDLKLEMQETVEGSKVKDILTDYKLIISRVHASIQVNPWGLVIAGYAAEPKRIKTKV